MIKHAAAAVLAIVTVAAAVVGCSDADSDVRGLVLGSTDAPEMQVMTQIYAGALRNAGNAVSETTRTGSYSDLLDDMDATSVDLFPAFSGRLLEQLAPQLTPATPDDVYHDLNRALPQGVSVGDATMVTATPQVFVAARVAETGHLADLTDCRRLPEALPLVVVGKSDESARTAFVGAGCRFGSVQEVPTVTEAVDRVASGSAVGLLTPLEVAGEDAEGAAGQIRALQPAEPAGKSGPDASQAPGASTSDTLRGARAEQLVPVYRTAALGRDQVKTINTVAGEITTADLATLARRAQRGEDPHELAVTWLGEHGL
ncbi:glycine betaine ABC transporter substrate-binding protein [Gordonia sp. CPCC 206044]|uniref:glycine betaine ABC transporter substrate-binding protein n=1 Tax=Gordonia sp. CPCC 206044 TaxID=3140793 RepID=UPI003AF3392D